MSFDDGQKAILRDLIAKEIADGKDEAERLSKEVAQKAIAEREAILLEHKQENTPFWKPWTKGQKQLSALGLAVMVGLFVYDKTPYGADIVRQGFHGIVGTAHYLDNHVTKTEATSGFVKSILRVTDAKYDLGSDTSEVRKKIDDAVGNFVEAYEEEDHPLPPAVRDLLEQRPVLVFHGEAKLGIPGNITAHLVGCDRILERFNEGVTDQTELATTKLCEIEASVTPPDNITVPFYAPLFGRGGGVDADALVFFSITKRTDISESTERADIEAQLLKNLEIYYQRQTRVSERLEETRLTEFVEYQGDGFFLIKLSEILKDQLDRPGLQGGQRQSKFHAISISANDEFVSDGDWAAMQVMVFVNRAP